MISPLRVQTPKTVVVLVVIGIALEGLIIGVLKT